MPGRTAWLLAWTLTPLAAVSCSRAHAKTTPDAPALSVPAPPPRLIEPAEAETPPTAPAPAQPEEPARRPAARPRPAAPAPGQPAATAEKAPEKPAESKPAEESKAPTSLQTTPAGAEGELERAIRGVLAKATSDLNRVDYRNLNADARTQYDTAKRFVQQAEEALRGRNLVFARNLADKAAALAGELAGK